MGKFDWGRFGSALATNVGNTGQQFFMNKMLQEDEDKRAYVRSQADALTKLYQSSGNEAYLDELEKLNDKGASATAATFRKAPLPTQEQLRQQELAQYEEQKKIDARYKEKAKPTALETKLGLLDTPEGREKLQALAEIANTLSVKDQAYLKNLGLDIQIKERKLTGNEPIPTQELERYPEEVAGTTYKEVREKGTRPLSVKDRDVLSNIRKGRAIIKRAKALADQLITAEGPAEVNIQRAKLGLGKVSGMNPQAKKYMDFIEANKSVIAKALKMQVGNLAIEEQEAAKAEFAQFNDWKQTSQDKYDNLIRQLDANEQSILTGKYVEPEPLSESEGGKPDSLGIR